MHDTPGSVQRAARRILEGSPGRRTTEDHCLKSEQELFPTGQVISKHFRELTSGREILMLELDRVRGVLVDLFVTPLISPWKYCLQT